MTHSYNNACAAYGTSCVRIAYLSNPGVAYGSPPDPTGSTSTADTARVHNQNALTVANFRASKQGGGTTSCTWSLSPGSASVGGAAGTGSIGVTTQAGCAWNAASNAGWLTTGAGYPAREPSPTRTARTAVPPAAPRSRSARLHSTYRRLAAAPTPSARARRRSQRAEIRTARRCRRRPAAPGPPRAARHGLR